MNVCACSAGTIIYNTDVFTFFKIEDLKQRHIKMATQKCSLYMYTNISNKISVITAV